MGALRPHYAEDQSVRKVYVRLVVSSRREANDVFDDRFSVRAEWFEACLSWFVKIRYSLVVTMID